MMSANSSVSSSSRLILCAYYFPPLAAAGTHRAIRLCRHLPKFGWEVDVVTASHSAHNQIDPSLVEELPESLNIQRVYSFEGGAERGILQTTNPILSKPRRALRNLFRLIASPDEKVGWVPGAVHAVKQLHGKHPASALITTGTPFSAHLIGLRTSKRLGIRWVADFRDPWFDSPYRQEQPTWRRQVDQYLERRVVETADYVVLNTAEVRELYVSRYQDLPPNRFVTIGNGCEFPSDVPAKPLEGPFTILYAGDFYGIRSPAPFLRAFKQWISDRNLTPVDVQVVFIGNFGRNEHNEDNRDLLTQLELEPYVSVEGPVTYSESLARMKQASALLLMGSDLPEDILFVPAKLYDYLTASRPILAIIHQQGTAAKILSKIPSHHVVGFQDSTEIAVALDDLMLHATQRGDSAPIDRKRLYPYSAERMAKSFAELLSSESNHPCL